MDRACSAGNGRMRYGLVDGARPWSWLLGSTCGLSCGLATGGRRSAASSSLAGPGLLDSLSPSDPLRHGRDETPPGLVLGPDGRLRRPVPARGGGSGQHLGWCLGDVELSGLGRSGASPSRRAGEASAGPPARSSGIGPGALESAPPRARGLLFGASRRGLEESTCAPSSRGDSGLPGPSPGVSGNSKRARAAVMRYGCQRGEFVEG